MYYHANSETNKTLTHTTTDSSVFKYVTSTVGSIIIEKLSHYNHHKTIKNAEEK